MLWRWIRHEWKASASLYPEVRGGDRMPDRREIPFPSDGEAVAAGGQGADEPSLLLELCRPCRRGAGDDDLSVRDRPFAVRGACKRARGKRGPGAAVRESDGAGGPERSRPLHRICPQLRLRRPHAPRGHVFRRAQARSAVRGRTHGRQLRLFVPGAGAPLAPSHGIGRVYGLARSQSAGGIRLRHEARGNSFLRRFSRDRRRRRAFPRAAGRPQDDAKAARQCAYGQKRHHPRQSDEPDRVFARAQAQGSGFLLGRSRLAPSGGRAWDRRPLLRSPAGVRGGGAATRCRGAICDPEGRNPLAVRAQGNRFLDQLRHFPSGRHRVTAISRVGPISPIIAVVCATECSILLARAALQSSRQASESCMLPPYSGYDRGMLKK
ncbi:hypothetical protein BN871_FM_00360 [Paenibacillus sp. P22]|nr:hypothetical protein BN871_FM_00360 [Paenibacillus sp. P22]